MNGYIPVAQDAVTQTDLSSIVLGNPQNGVVANHVTHEKDGQDVVNVVMATETEGERTSLHSSRDEEVEAGVEGGGGGGVEGGGGGDGGDGGEDEEDFDVTLSKKCCCCSCPRWNFTPRQLLQETKVILKLAWPNVSINLHYCS